uniref:Uncharacterized protein n=1 Tax=Peronospora matthiolae TaxID=2874970 RepID=A0AAV1TSW8_9STRA
MENKRTPETHAQSLRATRFRKVTKAASAALAAAAVPEHTKQVIENTAAIRQWVSSRKKKVPLPDFMPIDPNGQLAWITSYVSELEALLSVLPFPVPFLASMTGESLKYLVTRLISNPSLCLFANMPATQMTVFVNCALVGQQQLKVKGGRLDGKPQIPFNDGVGPASYIRGYYAQRSSSLYRTWIAAPC